MKKFLLASAAVAAAALPSAPALAQDSPHAFTANVGLFSEYIFRGITQTAGEPAVQGGFDYAHSSGFYAGTWASNVSWLEDWNLYKNSSLEWDFYAGFKRNFGGTDFYYDFGTIYYYYPGNRNPGVTSANTWEIYGGFGWKWLGVKVSYNLDDYFGARPTGKSTDGTWYVDFFANYPIGETGFAVNGHFGILDVANDGSTSTATKLSYNDWKLGASYTVPSGVLKNLEVGAYYTDNDAHKASYTDPTGYDTRKARLVAYVKKTF